MEIGVMKKNHNKLYYFIVIALMILGLTSCSSFNDSSINQNYIYTDESIPLCGDISESEKNILNEYLSAIYILKMKIMLALCLKMKEYMIISKKCTVV